MYFKVHLSKFNLFLQNMFFILVNCSLKNLSFRSLVLLCHVFLLLLWFFVVNLVMLIFGNGFNRLIKILMFLALFKLYQAKFLVLRFRWADLGLSFLGLLLQFLNRCLTLIKVLILLPKPSVCYYLKYFNYASKLLDQICRFIL